MEAAKRLEYHQRLTLPEYEQLGKVLQLAKPIDEDVFVYLKKKAAGGFRCFCDFGARHRAAQAIVSDMLKAQFEPKPYQYGVDGRGLRVAIEAGASMHGYTHVVRLDVKAFYDSFDHAAIRAAAPLPKAIIESVAIGAHLQMKAGITTGTNTGGAHQQYPIHRYIKFIRQAGIPQGSACPAIGSFFVSKLDFTLPKGAVVLNDEDYFLVMAKSAEKREKATITLKASLEALSVGNFELLEKSSGSIPSGFTFLTLVRHGAGWNPRCSGARSKRKQNSL